MVIDHEQGIKAFARFLKRRNIRFLGHTNMILDMIRFCLTNHFFTFNGDLFTQTNGTAMGTCFAPSFANLFMGAWEEDNRANINFQNAFARVILWLRYIDDIFVVWHGEVQEALQFIDDLNHNERNLTLTSTISRGEVEYLDTKVQIVGNKVHTILYRKSTAGNTLLHALSSHPDNLKWSIP